MTGWRVYSVPLSTPITLLLATYEVLLLATYEVPGEYVVVG